MTGTCLSASLPLRPDTRHACTFWGFGWALSDQLTEAGVCRDSGKRGDVRAEPTKHAATWQSCLCVGLGSAFRDTWGVHWRTRPRGFTGGLLGGHLGLACMEISNPRRRPVSAGTTLLMPGAPYRLSGGPFPNPSSQTHVGSQACPLTLFHTGGPPQGLGQGSWGEGSLWMDVGMREMAVEILRTGQGLSHRPQSCGRWTAGTLLCRQLEDGRSSGPRVQMPVEAGKEPRRVGGECWRSVLSQVTPDSGQESPGRVWVCESTWVGQGLLLRAQEGLQVPGRLRIDPSLP